MPRWLQFPLAIAALIGPAGLLSTPLTRAQSTPISVQTSAPTATPTSTQTQLRETLGVTFNAPSGFSEVQSLSRQTRGIVYPEKASDGAQMVIRLAELETNPENWVQFNPQEELGYAKYLLLGGNPPSEAFSQRVFLGQSIRGESQTRSTHNGYRYTEIYVVPLESGRKIAIAFDADTLVPVQTVENAINTVSQSLAEAPSKKQKKQKQKRATQGTDFTVN